MNTLAERIFKAETGEIVRREVDRVMLHDGNMPLIFERLEGTELYDTSRVTAVTDHFCPPSTIERSGFVKRFREFVKSKKIDDHIEFKGICHQMMLEGRVRPGELVVGIDSHSTTYGALGAYGVGLGSTDTAEVLETGGTWFMVPETVKVNIRKNAPGTDLALDLLRQVKYSCNYRSIEFRDHSKNDVDTRATICNMAAETGAKAAVFPTDEITTRYLERYGISGEMNFSSDGSVCERVIDVELSEPLVAVPHKPYSVKKATQVQGTTIDQVVLGSCASGRYSDIKSAAEALKNRSIHPDVRMLVIPSSVDILKRSLEDGYIQTMLEAGAVLLNPSCGPCAGIDKGIIADGEVCLSTFNRNYQGRMGPGDIYIANAEICALSAIEGVLTVPEGCP